MSPKGKTSKVGMVVDERFKVTKKIGAGAFGDIYFAEEINSGNKYAIKFESIKQKCMQLPVEYRSYQSLINEIGFPQCFYYNQIGNDLILVMDLLGKNLKELFEMCGKKFSLKTVLYIAMQTISRMETLHSKHLVYRDIKPENFMIGLPGTEAAKIIHLIDLGMVKEFIDPKTGAHIPMRTGKPVTGTARYMSINAHFGYELSRRDDLEALGYMFLFFLKGTVPWSGLMNPDLPESSPLKQFQKIGSLKQALRPEDLFEGFPKEFADYLDSVRGLQFEETPNYDAYRRSFYELFAKLKLEDDGVFDWDTLLANEATSQQ